MLSDQQPFALSRRDQARNVGLVSYHARATRPTVKHPIGFYFKDEQKGWGIRKFSPSIWTSGWDWTLSRDKPPAPFLGLSPTLATRTQTFCPIPRHRCCFLLKVYLLVLSWLPGSAKFFPKLILADISGCPLWVWRKEVTHRLRFLGRGVSPPPWNGDQFQVNQKTEINSLVIVKLLQLQGVSGNVHTLLTQTKILYVPC